jgi:uncharacterized membrane protein HdeD (DUF308 family)
MPRDCIVRDGKVVFVGVIALARGVTDIVNAFRLRKDPDALNPLDV